MKLTAILLLLLVLPVALLAQTQEPAQSPSLVFTHVVVIDATGAPAQSDMTVVITKRHITALGKTDTVATPQEAHVVDASGKFLIPGLWDMHVHTAFDLTPGGKDISLPLFIANGVTGVRDMGGDLAALQQWRQQITQGTLIGPHIMASGPMLDGEFAPFPNSLPIATAAEGQEAVEALKRQGVDFIKIQSLLPRDAYFAVAAEAKKQGLLFAGHVPDAVSAREASDAGQRSMEHLIGMQFQNANDPVAVQMFTRFVKNGTWQCPTLVMRHNQALLAETDFRGDPRMKYIPGTWRWPPEVRPGSRVVYQQQVAVVGAMHKAGVRLLAGTDTAGPYIFPGFSLHEELELLVQAGLTPLEALQTATRNPAQYFGMSERFGTIQQEKVADLVLLDANPLEEISNTKKIAAVVVGGKLFTKDALQQMLANVEAAANQR